MLHPSDIRLRLVVRRHDLDDVRLVWIVRSDDETTLTISGLLDRISEVVPLECGEWGLEDYAVELLTWSTRSGSFECLHFQKVSDVLKDEDEVLIRPLDTDDLRRRRLSGRHQISAGGRRLIDGVAFGRPRLKVPRDRPEVSIPPRKRSRLTYSPDVASRREEDPPDELEDLEPRLMIRSRSPPARPARPRLDPDQDSANDRRIILRAHFEDPDLPGHGHQNGISQHETDQAKIDGGDGDDDDDDDDVEYEPSSSDSDGDDCDPLEFDSSFELDEDVDDEMETDSPEQGGQPDRQPCSNSPVKASASSHSIVTSTSPKPTRATKPLRPPPPSTPANKTSQSRKGESSKSQNKPTSSASTRGGVNRQPNLTRNPVPSSKNVVAQKAQGTVSALAAPDQASSAPSMNPEPSSQVGSEDDSDDTNRDSEDDETDSSEDSDDSGSSSEDDDSNDSAGSGGDSHSAAGGNGANDSDDSSPSSAEDDSTSSGKSDSGGKQGSKPSGSTRHGKKGSKMADSSGGHRNSGSIIQVDSTSGSDSDSNCDSESDSDSDSDSDSSDSGNELGILNSRPTSVRITQHGTAPRDKTSQPAATKKGSKQIQPPPPPSQQQGQQHSPSARLSKSQKRNKRRKSLKSQCKAAAATTANPANGPASDVPRQPPAPAIQPLAGDAVAQAALQTRKQALLDRLASHPPTADQGSHRTDPDAWRARVNYRAVECVDEAVVLSEPPFPFVQRWDPQQQLRHDLAEPKKRTAPDRFDRPTKKVRVREGLDAEPEFDASMYDDGPPSQFADPDDLPALPSDLSALAPLAKGTAQAGMILTWKSMELVGWQPLIVQFTGVVLASQDGGNVLQMCLAQRDRRAVKKPAADEEPGRHRKIRGPEAPNFDDMSDGDGVDDGLRLLAWDEMTEPRIVQAAGPPAADSPAAVGTGRDTTGVHAAADQGKEEGEADTTEGLVADAEMAEGCGRIKESGQDLVTADCAQEPASAVAPPHQDPVKVGDGDHELTSEGTLKASSESAVASAVWGGSGAISPADAAASDENAAVAGQADKQETQQRTGLPEEHPSEETASQAGHKVGDPDKHVATPGGQTKSQSAEITRLPLADKPDYSHPPALPLAHVHRGDPARGGGVGMDCTEENALDKPSIMPGTLSDIDHPHIHGSEPDNHQPMPSGSEPVEEPMFSDRQRPNPEGSPVELSHENGGVAVADGSADPFAIFAKPREGLILGSRSIRRTSTQRAAAAHSLATSPYGRGDSNAQPSQASASGAEGPVRSRARKRAPQPTTAENAFEEAMRRLDRASGVHWSAELDLSLPSSSENADDDLGTSDGASLSNSSQLPLTDKEVTTVVATGKKNGAAAARNLALTSLGSIKVALASMIGSTETSQGSSSPRGSEGGRTRRSHRQTAGLRVPPDSAGLELDSSTNPTGAQIIQNEAKGGRGRTHLKAGPDGGRRNARGSHRV